MNDPFKDSTEFADNVIEIVTDPDFGFHRLLTVAALLDGIADFLAEIEPPETSAAMRSIVQRIRRRAIVE